MARRPKGNSRGFSQSDDRRTDDITWVNVKLDETDVADVVALTGTPDAIGVRMAGVFVGGYGFSVKFNPERKSFSAFIIGVPGHPGGKLVGISSYAPDGLTAVAAVLVKCDLFASDPSAYAEAGKGLGIG